MSAVSDWLARRERFLHALLVAAYLVMGVAQLRFGGFSHDEGFYAYAAWNVMQGETPYQDFMYPQSPLTAYVYGLSAVSGFDLYVMRGLAVAFGLGGVVLAALTARRLAGPVAGLLASAALVFSGTFSHVISPIPLTALLVILSAFVLTTRLAPAWRYALAGLLLGLATGVRLNVVVAIPVFVAYAWIAEGRRLAPALAGATAAGAAIVATYAPFAFADFAAAKWNLVTYHVLDGRAPGMGVASLVKYKLDGLHYFIQGFAFVVALSTFLALAFAFFARRAPRRLVAQNLLPVYLGVSMALVVAANFSKVYIQPYYIAAVLPVLAALVAVGVVRLLPRMGSADARALFAGLVVVLLALNFVALVPESIQRNRPAEDPALVREAGAYLASVVPEDGRIFTFRMAIAAEAERQVVPGTEMGQLSYYPAMPTDEARTLHVLNAELAKEMLANRSAAALALVGGEFTYTTFPTAELLPAEQAQTLADLRATLEAGYRFDRAFGVGAGAIEIWVPR